MLQHVKVSACGRDAAMELMIKNITNKTGVHWTRKFLDTDGRSLLSMIFVEVLVCLFHQQIK